MRRISCCQKKAMPSDSIWGRAQSHLSLHSCGYSMLMHLKSLIIWSVKSCASCIPGLFLVSFAKAFHSAWPLGCSCLSVWDCFFHTPASRRSSSISMSHSLFVDLNNRGIHPAQPSSLLHIIRSINSDPSSSEPTLVHPLKPHLQIRSCFCTEILYQSELHIDQYQNLLTTWVSDNPGVVFSYR